MSLFFVANFHTIMSPHLTLKWTTCLFFELPNHQYLTAMLMKSFLTDLTLTCTMESLKVLICFLIHSPLFIVTKDKPEESLECLPLAYEV